MHARRQGFTLIELLVVVTVIGTLLSLVGPRYWGGIEKAKEAVLREDLHVLRDAIGKYFTDHGRYPDSVGALVERKYVRAIPVDPVTDRSDTWVVIPPKDLELGKVADIRSGSAAKSRNGTSYASW